MAVGLGMLFGLRLPQNFNSPYQALDISDFWRRWHISLSSVLRDYLYIPLGGSRDGEARTYRNLMITMLLGGLWHGANWTFVCWGAYHGILLSLTRFFGRSIELIPKWVRAGLTFLLVVVGWVLFRAASFDMAVGILARMFTGQDGQLPVGYRVLAPTLVLSALLAHVGPNTFQISYRWPRRAVLAIACLFVICLAVIYGGNPSPFLYFQF
jgi:alginate O-acetyltransferase complex protein AlgI